MQILSKEEFNKIRDNGKVVVDFYADWCGPCKMLGPVLENISKNYEDVNFVKVNVDDNEELAAEFGIMSIPAVFMLKDGKPVNKFVGSLPEKNIIDILNESFK